MNGRHKSNIKQNYLLPLAFISILGKFRFRLNSLCFCHTSERKSDICLITGKEDLRKECRLTRKEFLNYILEALVHEEANRTGVFVWEYPLHGIARNYHNYRYEVIWLLFKISFFFFSRFSVFVL